MNEKDVDILKKYIAELEKATKTQTAFHKGIEGYSETLKKRLGENINKQEKLNDSLKQSEKLLSGRSKSRLFKKEMKELADGLDDADKKLLASTKSTKEFLGVLGNLQKDVKATVSSMSMEFLGFENQIKRVANSTEKSFSKSFKNAYKDAEEFLSKTDSGFRDLGKQSRGKKILGAMDPDLAKKTESYKKAGTAGADIGKGDLMQRALGKMPGMGGVASSFGKVKGITDTAREFNKLSLAMAASKGSTNAFAGAVDLVGTAFSSLGKAGVIGLLITAIVELGKAINSADKLIKGLNQDFLNIAGPASSLDNFTGRMKEFNDALYASSNVKLGLTAKEVYGLFEAINKSGLSTQGLGGKVASYGDSIEAARKLSIQFGVALNDMGGMMATQMLDLRSSLKDVSSTFDVLAYDAGKAGIQSDKFYQSVDAASSSLSFYGNYLKKASGMLRDFSTSGTMGFKDAAKQTTDMMSLYKNLSKSQKFAIVSLLGPKKVDEILTGIATELQAKTDDISTKIKKNIAAQATAPEDKKKALKEELLILEKERDIAEANKVRNKYALEQGDIYDKAEGLLSAVDKTPEWLLTLLKVSGQDIFKGSLAAQTYLESRAGVTSEIFDKFKNDLLVMQSVFTDFNKKFKENTDKLSETDIANVSEVLKGYDPNKEDSVKNTKEALTPLLSKVIKDKGELEKFMNFLMRYSRSKNLVTGETGGDVAGLLKGQLTPDQINAAAESTYATQGVEGVAPIKAKDFSGIIKKITPLQKYFKISKEALGYTIASSDAATNTLNVLSDIFGKVSEIAVSVGKMASSAWFGGEKTKGDLTKDTPFIKALAKNEAIAQTGVQSAMDELLKNTPEAGITIEDIPDIYKKWSGTEADKKEVMDTFKDIPIEDLTKVMDAYSKKIQSSNALSDITDKYPVSLQSDISDLVELAKNEALTSPTPGVVAQPVGKSDEGIFNLLGDDVPEARKLDLIHAMNPGPTDWEKTKKYVSDFLKHGHATWGEGLGAPGNIPDTFTTNPDMMTGENSVLMPRGDSAATTNSWGGIQINTNGGNFDRAAIPELQAAFERSVDQIIRKHSLSNMKRAG